MIQPEEGWVRFQDDSEKLEYMKNHGLIAKTAESPKQLVYTGAYGGSFCTLLGYVNDFAAVVSIHGQLHCIMPEYLKEMQQGLVSLHLPEQYVVLDIETSGLSPKIDSIIEIAAVKYCSGIQTDTYESLVFTDDVLPMGIQSLTGISPDEILKAPPLEQVISSFSNFIGGLPLVAHNAPFDLGFLRIAFSKCGLSLSNEGIDTLKLARKAFPELEHHTLSCLKEHLGILVDTSHRALPDALATGELYIRCTEQLVQNRSDLAGEEGTEARPAAKETTKQARAHCGTDPNHPFFHKTIVFTGTMDITRDQAASLAEACGAIIKNTVSNQTDYVVAGTRGESSGPISAKRKKAEDLITAGASIKILTESEFMKLLGGNEGCRNDESNFTPRFRTP